MPTLDVLLHVLGLAILHFLWQGAIIGLGAALALRLARTSPPSTRYGIACIAQVGCLLTFVSTVFMLLPSGVPAPALGASMSPEAFSLLASAAETGDSGSTTIKLIAWAWAAGVALLFLRVCLQWIAARRLKTELISDAPASWNAMLQSLCVDIGIRRAVRLAETGAARVPMVIGWLSPVVLIPTSAFLSLTPEQLRAVLAHELAHVRRHDHLINAVQAVIETVLFFHPVVWWLSNEIRVEREHCCDDVAVRCTGSSRDLATALAALESLRVIPPQAAMAANGGPLMDRINRLVGVDRSPRATTPRWRAIAALSAGALIAATSFAHANRPATNDDVAQVLRDAVALGMDETQARNIYNSLIFTGSDAESEMSLKMASLQARIQAALETGDLDAEEASAKLRHIEGEMAEYREMLFATEILGLTPAELHMRKLNAEMDRLVEAGEMTADEADLKAAFAAQQIEIKHAAEAHMAQALEDLKAKVEAGELSERDARRHMANMKEGVEKRVWWANANAEIDAALQSGMITAEEADEKRELLHRRAAEAKAMDSTKARLSEASKQLAKAIELGEMTEAEAKTAYAQLEAETRRIGIETKSREMLTRAKAAVERGEMTAEEARTLLQEAKRQLEVDAQKAQRNARMEAALARVAGAVERGEMTRDDANRTIGEMRRRMAAAENSEATDAQRTERFRALEARIAAAIESGRITDEEGAERLTEARRRLLGDR